MTSTSIRAALTAALLLGAATTAYAADDKPKPPKLTPAVAKSLGEAQTANNKKDYPTALAAIDKAKAVDGRTAADNVMIGRFAMAVHIGMNDFVGADADAEAAADAALGDPTATTEAAAVFKPAMQLALNSKHYDKAAKYAKAYQATNPPAADMPLIAQAYYLGGDYDGATAIAQKNIDAAKAANAKPARNDLDIVMSAQVKKKDEAGAEATLEMLVQYYNDPADWGQILGVSMGGKGMTDIDYVYLGRLINATGAKVTSADVQLVGSTANKNALYGDAEAFQKMGGPAPDPREAADKKSIPDQIKISQGPKGSGEFDVKLGEALYGYGQYQDAINAAQLAKQKGGTKDAIEADMVIGQSQAALGQYDAAATTFAGVTAPNPARARVVRLWGYYARSKTSGATAAAAPAK
jgi:tetratricopeptide (TPR) repeat protein